MLGILSTNAAECRLIWLSEDQMQLYTILAITNTTQAYVHWNRRVCHTVVPSEQQG
jgi:hypothetical protein